MRSVLLVAAFAAVPLSGEEAPPLGLREAIHALIMESVPELPAQPPPAEPTEPVIKEGQHDDDVVVLEPIVVVAENVQALARMLAREERREQEGKFDPIQGGTIFHKGRLRIGTWVGTNGAGLDLVRIAF